MELDLFLDLPGASVEDQLEHLKSLVCEMRESHDKVRKRLFSEINDLKKTLLSLQLDVEPLIKKPPKDQAWDLWSRDEHVVSSGKIISISTA